MIEFGTGGWRAEIGKEFHMENVQKVGQAMANRIVAEGRQDTPVIVGYDRRFLSAEAAHWLAEMLAGQGITVWFMRRSVPTPLVMHTVLKQKLYYGMEVTASHNPSSYNGIKVIVEEGRDAPTEFTESFQPAVNALSKGDLTPMDFEEAVEKGLIVYQNSPFNDFLDNILEVLDTKAIRDKGPRILFDPMHGSSTYPLMALFYTARCTVDLVNDDKDAYFGGKMPAPTAVTLQELSQRVVAGGYDLGIGIDGDGDRLGIIDSDGTYVDANDILLLLYYYLHEHKGWKGAVVRNLSTTHLLDRLAKSLGEECYEVPVGFKYISSKIDEVDAVLGGESSGGLTVRGHIHGKDSVYAAVLFVEMLCVTGKSAGQLVAELKEKLGTLVMETENLSFHPARKGEILKAVMEDKLVPQFEAPIVRVSYMDGCKVYFEDDSFVSCRFSGTEPLLRIFAEAETSQLAKSYIKPWREMLHI
ncbi:MAG: phosphoglucomutase/phosphomannomutase family protein [Eubacteriales bacterium]